MSYCINHLLSRAVCQSGTCLFYTQQNSHLTAHADRTANIKNDSSDEVRGFVGESWQR